MLKVSSDGDGYPRNWARSCDACHAVPCTHYCHTDSAYLCRSCDEHIHAANPLNSKHQRVWVCTLCENAPAAFTCQADAANLCINCDIEIHLANPLAHRHNRVPIPPISGVVNTFSTGHLEELQGALLDTEKVVANKSTEELEEDETDSWLLLDLDNNDNSGFTYGEDVDECLDLIEYSSCAKYQCHDQTDQCQLSSVHQGDNGSDSVVPVQSFEAKDQQDHYHQQNIFADSGYEASKAASNTTSSSQKVSLSFTNAGYLLTTSNIPNSHSRFSNGKTELLPNPSPLMPLQFTPMNREAKVLRYREKRKRRKFEKKIRYAARKANAESRPCVKGRFSRKVDMEFDVDQMFATEDYGFGIVPSDEVK